MKQRRRWQSKLAQERNPMWNFLFGLLFARATGMSRFIRLLLLLILVGSVIAGFIYAALVFYAVTERNRTSHVYTHRVS